MKFRTTALLAPVFALAALAAPTEAHAQFRASAQLGIEHLSRDGGSTTMFQSRAEFALRVAPSFEVGAYAQHLYNTDRQSQENGWGLGAIATLRPMSDASWGPLAFGSLGYQRAPDASVFRDGLFFELGGGLAWRPVSVLDVELRGSFVGLVGGERELTGFNAGIALSVHP